MSAISRLFADSRGDAPSPEEIALAVAKDFDPELDLAETRAEIERLARPLGDLSREPRDRQVARMAEHLFRRLGFRGNSESYYDPANSLIHHVVARRTGLPLSLSVVLIAVARRAGAVAEPIGFPGHFLARIGGEQGLLVDAFAGGRVVGETELEVLAKQFLGDASKMSPDHIRPVDARALATRIVANLKNAYERRGDHGRALFACDSLVELTGAPEHRRDRGLHALALGSYVAAVDDLAAYLAARPAARDRVSVRVELDRARRARETAAPS